VLVTPRTPMRLVTHLDIAAEDIPRVVSAAGEFFTAAVRRAG
jgi:hypothetical protein